MSTWLAHHIAGAFIFKVIFTAVRHLSRLHLGCLLHFLSTRVVRWVTMETLTHLLLFSLYLWQKQNKTGTHFKRNPLQSSHIILVYFVSGLPLNTLRLSLSSGLQISEISPVSERCCLSIFSSLPRRESILFFICDSSFLIVSSWSVFTASKQV